MQSYSLRNFYTHGYVDLNPDKIYRRSLLKFVATILLYSQKLKAQNKTPDYITVTDHVLAYEFSCPKITAKGEPINLTFSRRPEKYSSAAPLSADARQRIVCELVDLTAALTLSVSVCAPTENLRDRSINDWKPTEVAEEVLKDRYMSRTTLEKKSLLNKIESIEVNEHDGQTYWCYEHTTQSSPNIINPEDKFNLRHTLSVSAVRIGLEDGKAYIYTLNVTSPEILWPEVSKFAKETTDSFKLLQPTPEFITPEKDPWLFF